MIFGYSEFSINDLAYYTLPVGYEGQSFQSIQVFHELFKQSLTAQIKSVACSPLQERSVNELDAAAGAVLNSIPTQSELIVNIEYQNRNQVRCKLPMALHKMLDARNQSTAGAETRSLNISRAPNGISLRIFKWP